MSRPERVLSQPPRLRRFKRTVADKSDINQCLPCRACGDLASYRCAGCQKPVHARCHCPCETVPERSATETPGASEVPGQPRRSRKPEPCEDMKHNFPWTDNERDGDRLPCQSCGWTRTEIAAHGGEHTHHCEECGKPWECSGGVNCELGDTVGACSRECYDKAFGKPAF